jgi:hypothetical protein
MLPSTRRKLGSSSNNRLSLCGEGKGREANLNIDDGYAIQQVPAAHPSRHHSSVGFQAELFYNQSGFGDFANHVMFLHFKCLHSISRGIYAEQFNNQPFFLVLANHMMFLYFQII